MAIAIQLSEPVTALDSETNQQVRLVSVTQDGDWVKREGGGRQFERMTRFRLNQANAGKLRRQMSGMKVIHSPRRHYPNWGRV